jgi:thiol-disulfide isomerase/thioredoxin
MKLLRLTLLLTAASLLAFASVRAETLDPKPAPAWTLKDLNGKDVSSADFKGKVLVVDFWATWCGPCRHEIPGYVELQKKYGPDGLVIVGIAVSDTAERVKKFATEQGLNYVILLDDGTGVPEKFGNIEAIPTTFIIDRDGNLRDRKVGAEDTDVYERTLLPYLKKA